MSPVLRKLWVSALAIGVVAAAALSVAFYLLRQRPAPQPEPVDIALGATIFRQNCAVCHGTIGEGRDPAPPMNRTGHAHHHPDWELHMVIAEGKIGFAEMPAWKGKLTDHEIRSVIAYIKTLWTEDQRRFQEEVSRARPTPP